MGKTSEQNNRLSLSDIEKMTVDFLTVEQVAKCMNRSPQMIRDQAERDPKYLGFPISKICHRYSIPREGFLNWAKWSVKHESVK